MSYLEELLPEFRKGAKIRCKSWKNGAYIEKKGQGIIYHNIPVEEFNVLADDFELYQEPIDYDYIIKNKCLCIFWDDEEFSLIGSLTKIDTPEPLYKDYKYQAYNGRYWKHCRPARRDEVTFYEDRKDE